MPLFEHPAPIITTPRLLLRPVQLGDAPVIQRNFEKFEVVRYLNKSVPWPYPPDGAKTFIEKVMLPAVQAGKERSWALTLKGEMIGAIAVSCGSDENRGFWLAPEHWGRGLMAEASEAVTNYVMGELCWPELMTGNAAGNLASAGIKRRQGFEHVATFRKEFVGGAMDYEQWRLTRDAWLKRHPGYPDDPQ